MTRMSMMVLALVLIAAPVQAQFFAPQACQTCRPVTADLPPPPAPPTVQPTTPTQSPIHALLGLIRETESADTFALTTLVLSNTQMSPEEAAECIVTVLQSAERLKVSDGFVEAATKQNPSIGHQALADCVTSLAEKLAARRPMPQDPLISPASYTPTLVQPSADFAPAVNAPHAPYRSARPNTTSTYPAPNASNPPSLPQSSNPAHSTPFPHSQ